jgi:hypothetical protein
MGFYNDRIVPHLVRVAMRQQKLLPADHIGETAPASEPFPES